MMGRILGLNPQVYTFRELHFFEQLWDGDASADLARAEALLLAARLIAVQRDGYLSDPDPEPYLRDAKHVVADGRLTPPAIFERFLAYEARGKGRSIPCDQTPRNVFYIREILAQYPKARVVNMVRDPRDVVLSQKRKWRRRYLGANKIPRREAFRSWVNYHPVTVSRLWLGSVKAAARWSNHSRVTTVRFEDLLVQPEETVRVACRFLGVTFTPDMLAVAVAGSSSERDVPERRGIDPGRTQRWRRGGLDVAEVRICERIAGVEMQRHGYVPAVPSCKRISVAVRYGTFPLKLTFALLLNLRRMQNPVLAIRRRLGSLESWGINLL